MFVDWTLRSKEDLLSLPQNTTKASKCCVTSSEFSSLFTETDDHMIYYEHKHSWRHFGTYMNTLSKTSHISHMHTYRVLKPLNLSQLSAALITKESPHLQLWCIEERNQCLQMEQFFQLFFKFTFSVAQTSSALMFRCIDCVAVGHKFSTARAPLHNLWFINQLQRHVKISSRS